MFDLVESSVYLSDRAADPEKGANSELASNVSILGFRTGFLNRMVNVSVSFDATTEIILSLVLKVPTAVISGHCVPFFFTAMDETKGALSCSCFLQLENSAKRQTGKIKNLMGSKIKNLIQNQGDTSQGNFSIEAMLMPTKQSSWQPFTT